MESSSACCEASRSRLGKLPNPISRLFDIRAPSSHGLAQVRPRRKRTRKRWGRGEMAAESRACDLMAGQARSRETVGVAEVCAATRALPANQISASSAPWDKAARFSSPTSFHMTAETPSVPCRVFLPAANPHPLVLPSVQDRRYTRDAHHTHTPCPVVPSSSWGNISVGRGSQSPVAPSLAPLWMHGDRRVDGNGRCIPPVAT